MDDMSQMLRRANLRTLGRFLVDPDIPAWIEEEEFSEESIKLTLEDELRLALRNGGENLEARIRAVTTANWEKGELVGFMEGMRAGARVALALLGDGPVRI